MTIQTRTVDYQHGDVTLRGYMAWDDAGTPRAPVLVAPTWAGRTDFENQQAEKLAALGYVGFAVDMYGDGKTGNGPEECTALMTPVVSDRALLQARMGAALDAARAQPEVSEGDAAAIGFCFGGLCVLDLARSRSDISGVVSFHGLLTAPDNLDGQSIAAKVLVLHGYEDPMVEPDAVVAFCDEMRARGCDWQVHSYGQTLHAFTNPQANDPDFGTVYSELAASRSFASMRAFLTEVLG